MTARELRLKYLRFFESKGHTVYPSGSLVPTDVTGRLDESLLFNGAGMVQFKPFFRGAAEPPNKRLTTAQKCVRTGDIETVGDLTHLTFFEMMGNFSFGDYFKDEAIAYSWEFLTSPDWLGLDPHRLAFTVFTEDDVAFEAWSKHLIAEGIDPFRRIFRLGEESNYWPAGAFSSGPPGPCGPNSEMFYWTADTPPPSGPYTREDYLRDEAEGKWLEIWNDVFIQYEWKGRLRNPDRPNEGYEKEGMPSLPFQSVDTGMGLERTIAVLNGLKSVYDSDLFTPIIGRIHELASLRITGRGEFEGTIKILGEEVGSGDFETSDETVFSPSFSEAQERAVRIIADHFRTACFCIADGILPSNTGRGYVLRRLIRRAVLKGLRVLGFEQPFFHLVYEGVVEAMGDHYHELMDRRDVIVETLLNEETQFRRTMVKGQDQLFWYLDRLRERRADVVTALDYVELHKPTGGKDDLLSLFDRMGLFSGAEIVSSLELNEDWHPGIIRVNLAVVVEPYLNACRNGAPQIERDQIREEALSRFRILPGDEAYKLYDTYGFPLEVTKELCEEAGVAVDEDGYEVALKEAQERSRGASDMDTVYGGGEEKLLVVASPRATPFTNFVGYDRLEHQTEIVQISPRFGVDGLSTGEFQVCLFETPFYAESGGQVGDTGLIEGSTFRFAVQNTWKELGMVWHDVVLEAIPLMPGVHEDQIRAAMARHGRPATHPLAGFSPEEMTEVLESGLFFVPVFARVDAARRNRIIRNHSATHLLHAALRSVLGKHVTQAGSLVSPDHLRFDFTHGKAMTEDELTRVEAIVNQVALGGVPITIYQDLPIDEARARGAMALFGEKYGDRVRMVEVGDFSRELCGGCHVRQTSEIGLFRIVHESSAASGVRRIEAVTGESAYDMVREQSATLRHAAGLLKSTPHDLVHAIERQLEAARDERKRRERAEQQLAKGGSSGGEAPVFRTIGAVRVWTPRYDGLDPKIAASAIDDAVAANPDLVVVGAIVGDGKVSFVAKVGAEALKSGAHAGNLVREVAKIAGGGGGGRPDFATAGGKDLSKIDEALAVVDRLLASS